MKPFDFNKYIKNNPLLKENDEYEDDVAAYKDRFLKYKNRVLKAIVPNIQKGDSQAMSDFLQKTGCGSEIWAEVVKSLKDLGMQVTKRIKPATDFANAKYQYIIVDPKSGKSVDIIHDPTARKHKDSKGNQITRNWSATSIKENDESELGICPECKEHCEFKRDEDGDFISDCCGAEMSHDDYDYSYDD